MHVHNQDNIENGDAYESDSRHAYLEWLAMEARLLRIELYGMEFAAKELTPCNTFAGNFHFPAGGDWRDVPPPSTRAETVMRAVGVQMPEVR